KVDFGVLSHAHYDHGDGIEAFFKANKKAKFYIRGGASENCYRRLVPKFKYIGLRPGMLSEYRDRFEYVYGDYEISEGIYLIPHKTPGLSKIGKTSHMYVKKGAAYMPDDFSHEQSLVFDTSEGLVIFNSCSHAGAYNIVREVGETFSDKRIAAMIGGFHLFEKRDEEVRSFAQKVKSTGIKHVVTGHCTGDRAFEILKEEIPGVTQFHVGLTMEIGEKD
ncbi:MAG: MBL fold metallo-hydrolase, partial [Lachnospiraceae bacterium]|nr:MBL fold metallo-hydrolase [Lachnospiraceae bacterium]